MLSALIDEGGKSKDAVLDLPELEDLYTPFGEENESGNVSLIFQGGSVCFPERVVTFCGLIILGETQTQTGSRTVPAYICRGYSPFT